jgi:hypothetical protein
MKWSSMSVAFVHQLDWRQPWGWPRAFQNALFVGAGVLGVLLLSPWWLSSWQMWDEANAAQAQFQTQQESTQMLRVQTAQLLQTRSQPQASLADAAVLTQLAQQQGLQFSELGMDKPQQTNALNALHLQQLPVHLKVQGSWDGWLNWLAQLAGSMAHCCPRRDGGVVGAQGRPAWRYLCASSSGGAAVHGDRIGL